MPALADAGPHYIRVWRKVLTEWLHWSDDRVARWIQAFDPELDGRKSGSFYHESAVYYVIPLLVRNRLDEQLRMHVRGPDRAPEWSYFHREMLAAIDVGLNVYDPSFDWKEAQMRAESHLARYGETFPTPDEVTDYEKRRIQFSSAK